MSITPLSLFATRPSDAEGPIETGTYAVDPVRGRVGFVAPLASELALVGGAIFLYFFVRGLTETGVADAVAHAEQILRLERVLGLDVELAAQRYVVDRRWLVTGANWVYIWGHWPVIIGTLVWLGKSRPATYRCLRNAMFISGGIGLVIFALYPVAPPRLIDGPFVDTVTELSRSYRVLQPPALVNKFAAVPSLHVGWNFLVGVFIWRHARRPVLRWLGVLSPVLMTVAVVLTANHYVVDAVAGIVVALVGLKIAYRFGDRRTAPVDAADRMDGRSVRLVTRVVSPEAERSLATRECRH